MSSLKIFVDSPKDSLKIQFESYVVMRYFPGKLKFAANILPAVVDFERFMEIETDKISNFSCIIVLIRNLLLFFAFFHKTKNCCIRGPIFTKNKSLTRYSRLSDFSHCY